MEFFTEREQYCSCHWRLPTGSIDFFYRVSCMRKSRHCWKCIELGIRTKRYTVSIQRCNNLAQVFPWFAPSFPINFALSIDKYPTDKIATAQILNKDPNSEMGKKISAETWLRFTLSKFQYEFSPRSGKNCPDGNSKLPIENFIRGRVVLSLTTKNDMDDWMYIHILLRTKRKFVEAEDIRLGRVYFRVSSALTERNRFPFLA